MRLLGRHAVVTGGGTGIGAAIARALAAEGAKLTLVGRRAERLEAVASQLRAPAKAGAQDNVRAGLLPSQEHVLVAPADVTSRAQVHRAFASARETHGPIDILVNNAGAAQGAPFAKVTHELWRDMLAVNLDGMFHCCQAALADLVAAERGRIVTIASMAGLYGFAYAAPYIAAKHGAVGLTRALAAEYAATKLRANAVCPGFVDTDMTVESVSNIAAKTGRSEDEARAELARLNPSGRLVSPEEVAATVLDLILSERNGEAVEIA
ncbi:MAG TPA: SDR family NAD(P)-dependent oxidoreductase [Allosphingosinicella sp.]|jgi:NAD(P)-dependent dehydrogenase (short-subunit alcohol dehydrogenase family)